MKDLDRIEGKQSGLSSVVRDKSVVMLQGLLLLCFFAIAFHGTTIAQTKQSYDERKRRPVLVDDIRVYRITKDDLDDIPHLSSDQKEKIKQIDERVRKSIVGVNESLAEKMHQLEVLRQDDPGNAKAIRKKEKEVRKLQDKLNHAEVIWKKKVWNILDAEQKIFIDRKSSSKFPGF